MGRMHSRGYEYFLHLSGHATWDLHSTPLCDVSGSRHCLLLPCFEIPVTPVVVLQEGHVLIGSSIQANAAIVVEDNYSGGPTHSSAAVLLIKRAGLPRCCHLFAVLKGWMLVSWF